MKNKIKNVLRQDSSFPVIGIGMLGYGDMGKCHSNGYIQMPYIFWPPPAIPKLVNLCGRSEEMVRIASERFGFSRYTTNWQELIEDKEIQIFVNVGPNNIHLEPCIAAAQNGKHIVCEKPLGRNKEESKKMWDSVKKNNVKNICNFSNRMIPALVLAKKILLEEDFGKIYHFRINYLMDNYNEPDVVINWRMRKEIAGSGITGDLSIHAIDLARWLCGEPSSVISITKTFINERPSGKNNIKVKVDTDDALIAIMEFNNGSIGYIESTAYATGRRIFFSLEVNAEKGSIYWNFEEMGYLYVYYKNDKKNTRGFHKISVSQDFHPYYNKWLPFEEIPMGYNATFVHTAYHILDAVVNNTKLEPMIATFEDGYKASVICDAILKSARTGIKEKIIY